MLDALAAQIGFLSLHTGFPGTTGANEVTGGSPAYARKAHTWNVASGGALDNSNQPIFDVPAGTTVQFAGCWTAVTAGTFYAWVPLGATVDPIPFTAVGTTDILTADAHGLADTNQVIVIDLGSSAVIPTGLVEGTVYFVRDMVGDTFKLAATSGGVAIDLTTDGAGLVQRIIPETFGSQGTLTVTDMDLALIA
jgi:hypothetical protein